MNTMFNPLSSLNSKQEQPVTSVEFVPFNVPNSIPAAAACSSSTPQSSWHELLTNIEFLDSNSFIPPNNLTDIDLEQESTTEIPELNTVNSHDTQPEPIALITQQNSNKFSTILLYAKIIIVCTVISQAMIWLGFIVRKGFGLNASLSEVIIDSITNQICTSLIGTIGFTIYKNINEKKIKYLINYEKQKLISDHEKLNLKERIQHVKIVARQKAMIYSYLSHSLLNPLQGCLFGLDVINSIDEIQNLTPEQQEAIKITTLSIKKIDIVIKKLVELQKLAAQDSRNQADKQIFTLLQLIMITLKPFKQRAERKQLELICQANIPFDSKFNGYLHNLNQILTILISNAIKFTQQGFVKITIRQETEMPHNLIKLHFAVQDTGIGIEADKLKLLFKPYLATETREEEPFSPSSGLGLNVAYELIKQINKCFPHEQFLGVFSKTNQNCGTIFWFRATIEKYQPYPQATSSEVTQTNLLHNRFKPFNLNVLVVEDCQSNQIIMNKILTAQLGCKVTIVENGKVAVELGSKCLETFDIIFMDMEMPIINGLQATTIMRTKLHIKCPIIACTANNTEKDLSACIDSGMNEYIIKPVNAQKLNAVLERFFVQPNTGSTSSVDSLSQETSLLKKKQPVVLGDSGDHKPQHMLTRNSSQLLFQFKFNSYEKLDEEQSPSGLLTSCDSESELTPRAKGKEKKSTLQYGCA